MTRAAKTITPDLYRGNGATWARREELEQLGRQTQLNSQDSNTAIVTQGPDGPTLYVIARGIPAKITGLHLDSPGQGGNGELVYLGDLYGQGANKPATQTGVTIRILLIANGEQVKLGTWLMVSIAPQDTWTKKDGSTKTETTYQGQVPIWA